MTSELAPILLFVYKRPSQTRKTLEALSRNLLAKESVLYVYCDGPKDGMSDNDLQKISDVRKVVREKKWCKVVHIFESSNNKGLANSIINGVTKQISRWGKVIVLEDDLITSERFLDYMNHGLNLYSDEEKVMQISGHQFPIDIDAKGKSFFLHLTTSWGWATWERAWKKFDPIATGYEKLKTDRELSARFDFDSSYPYTRMLFNQMDRKTIDSWAIRWWWTVFRENGLSLFPDKPLVLNIGFGEEASHTSGKNPFEDNSFIINYLIDSFPSQITEDTSHAKKIQTLFRRNSPSLLAKTKRAIRKLFS